MTNNRIYAIRKRARAAGGLITAVSLIVLGMVNDAHGGVTELRTFREGPTKKGSLRIDYDGPAVGKDGKGWGRTWLQIRTHGGASCNCTVTMVDGQYKRIWPSGLDNGEYLITYEITGQPREINCDIYALRYTFWIEEQHYVSLKGSLAAPSGYGQHVRQTVFHSGQQVETKQGNQVSANMGNLRTNDGPREEVSISLDYADHIRMRTGEIHKLFDITGTGSAQTAVRCNGDACAQLRLIHAGETHSLASGGTANLYPARQASVQATDGAPGIGRGEIVIEASIQ